ncbi:MAG TPA: type II secretion system protein GspG [Candidatus Kapabacteria bacterium]|nr:type II secretion system protein GspG [Candidatus Kapabacteria bacterium]
MIKRVMFFLLTGILVGTVLMYPAVTKTKTQTIQPYGNNSFDVVTAKLDPGGNVYLYVGAERVMKSMDELAAKLREMIAKETSGPGTQDADVLKMFDLIYGMFKNSGLMDISGIGVSSIPIDADLNHSKFVAHHYKEKNSGLIWQMYEAQPHELAQLKMLPANTVFATSSDFRLKTLWPWLKKEAAASDLPKFKETILAIEPMLQQKGIPLENILNSIDSISFILTLDDSKKSIIPIGQQPLEIPEPAFAIILNVKDDSIFNLVQSKLPFGQPSTDPTIKKIQIPLPPLPVPIAPVIMQKDGLLIIASNNQIVDAMYAAKEKSDGLIATAEFKKMSVNIPTEGNSFRFVSQRFFKTMIEVQKKGVELSQFQESKKNTIMMALNLFAKDLASYGVIQNTEEGMICTFNHTLKLEAIFLLPVTAPAVIVAAIAVPNLITAAQKGKQKATMADMEAISMAIDAYIADHKVAPQGETLADIQAILQPKYIKELPLKDAWGNDYRYTHGAAAKKAEYAIGSAGKDGVFNGWEQTECYNVNDIKDFNNDLIIANGKFIFCPILKEKSQSCCPLQAEEGCKMKSEMKCERKCEMKGEKKCEMMGGKKCETMCGKKTEKGAEAADPKKKKES